MTLLSAMTDIVEQAADAVRLYGVLNNRTLRRSTLRHVQIKQFDRLESDITTAAAEVIRHQGNLVADRIEETGAATLAVIFDRREHMSDFIDALFPIIAKSMGESALASMVVNGKALNPELVDEAFAQEAVSPSDWLAGVAGTPEGISFEWPNWLIDGVQSTLKEQFEQPYWQKIFDTTSGDINALLENAQQEGLSIDQMARQIRDKFGGEEYPLRRGRLIARTESTGALGAGRDLAHRQMQQELGEMAGFIQKTWLSILDDRTRDVHAALDGTPADSDGMFNVDGTLVPWPGHFSLDPSQRCNCRCTLISDLVGI